MSVVGAGAPGYLFVSRRPRELDVVLAGDQPGALRFFAHFFGGLDHRLSGFGQFLQPRRLLVALNSQLVAVGGAERGRRFTADTRLDFLHRFAGAEVLIELLVQVRDDRVSRVGHWHADY